MVLEELNGTFVALCFLTSGKGSEVSAFACLATELSGIEAVLACLQFANHGKALPDIDSGSLSWLLEYFASHMPQASVIRVCHFLATRITVLACSQEWAVQFS